VAHAQRAPQLLGLLLNPSCYLFI